MQCVLVTVESRTGKIDESTTERDLVVAKIDGEVRSVELPKLELAERRYPKPYYVGVHVLNTTLKVKALKALINSSLPDYAQHITISRYKPTDSEQEQRAKYTAKTQQLLTDAFHLYLTDIQMYLYIQECSERIFGKGWKDLTGLQKKVFICCWTENMRQLMKEMGTEDLNKFFICYNERKATKFYYTTTSSKPIDEKYWKRFGEYFDIEVSRIRQHHDNEPLKDESAVIHMDNFMRMDHLAKYVG